MSKFERYLTVWVALCIVAGIALGSVMPGLFHAIGSAEIARVNLPVAALIWLMIVPMLLKIDFAARHCVEEHLRRQPSGPRRPASSSCGAAGSRRRHQRWRDSPKRTGLRLGTERQWFRPPGAPKAL